MLLILILKNLVVFFLCRVKIPYQQLLIFFNFMNTFFKSNETVIPQRCEQQLRTNLFFLSRLLRYFDV